MNLRKTWGYSFLYLFLLLIPTHGRGFFDGLPMSQTLEVIGLLFFVPLFLALRNTSAFLNSLQQQLILMGLGLKLVLFFLARQAGICLIPQQKFYESVFSEGCFPVKGSPSRTFLAPARYLSESPPKWIPEWASKHRLPT